MSRENQKLLQAWVPEDFASAVDEVAEEMGYSVKVLIQMSLSRTIRNHRAAKARKAAVAGYDGVAQL
jgi:antitoxin component of RelBE/YafQ-DinJ toxin-antitoxin module